jgi:hypothetical protein
MNPNWPKLLAHALIQAGVAVFATALLFSRATANADDASPTEAASPLTHLYTFNDATARDTAGNASGTVEHGGSITDGSLVLANPPAATSASPAAQFVRLPAKLLSRSSVTIEVWYTATTQPATAHLFDFGSADRSSQLYFNPHSGSAVLKQGSTTIIATGSATDNGAEQFAAIVIDASAGVLKLYENGAQAASASLGKIAMSGFAEESDYLGISNNPADGAFSGTIDELRIWDDPLHPPAISTDAAAGPIRGTVTPANIGAASSIGTGTYSKGIYTITSNAAPIGGNSDSFAFSNIPEFGDITLITKVQSFSDSTTVALAGLMLRDGLDPSAAFAGVFVSTEGSLVFQTRQSVGAAAISSSITGISIPTPRSPIWLKLVRAGQKFSGYYSTNDSKYMPIGSTQTFAMPVSTFGGLALASASAGKSITCKFARTLLSNPFAPLNFTAAATGSASTTLDWGQRPGLGGSTVSSYTLQRSSDGINFDSIASGLPGSARSYIDSAAPADRACYYQLTAYYGDGTDGSVTTCLATADSAKALDATLDRNWTTAQYISAYEQWETPAHVADVLSQPPHRTTLQDFMFCAGLYRVTTGQTRQTYFVDCISEMDKTAAKLPVDYDFSLAEFCYIYDQIKADLSAGQISRYQTAIQTMANNVIAKHLENGMDFNRGMGDMLGLAYSAKLLAGVSTFSQDANQWTDYYTSKFRDTFERIQDTDEDSVNYNPIWLDCLVKYIEVTGQYELYQNPNIKQIFYRYMQQTSSIGIIPNYGAYAFGQTIFPPSFLAAAAVYHDGQFTAAAQRTWNFVRAQPGQQTVVGIVNSAVNDEYWPAFDYSDDRIRPVEPSSAVIYENHRWGTTFPDKVVFNCSEDGSETDLLENLVNGMSHGDQNATNICGLIHNHAVLLASPVMQFSSPFTAASADIDTYEEYKNELIDRPLGDSFPQLPNVETQLGSGRWMHIVLNLRQGSPSDDGGGINLANITAMSLRIARGDNLMAKDSYDLYLSGIQAVGPQGTVNLGDFSDGHAWNHGKLASTTLPTGQPAHCVEIPAASLQTVTPFHLHYPQNLSNYSTIEFWMKLAPKPGASGVPLVQFQMNGTLPDGQINGSRWFDCQFDTYHEGPVTQMGSFSQMQFATVDSALDDTQGGSNAQLRSIIVLPGGIVWVRDKVTFGQNESAQIGPVWNVQNILAQGTHWYQTRQAVEAGQLGGIPTDPPGFMFFANQESLLVYFVQPTDHSKFDVGDTVSPYPSSDTPFGLYQRWSGAASSGQTETFNTALIANPVGTDPGNLTGTIRILKADDAATVAIVGDHYLVINPAGSTINAGEIQTDAAYLTITLTEGRSTYLCGSHATYVTLKGQTLFRSTHIVDTFEKSI